MMKDKLEQLEKNLDKDKEKVIKVKRIIKIDCDGLYLFGKKIFQWYK